MPLCSHLTVEKPAPDAKVKGTPSQSQGFSLRGEIDKIKGRENKLIFFYGFPPTRSYFPLERKTKTFPLRFACGNWMEENAHEITDENLFFASNMNQMTSKIDQVLQGESCKASGSAGAPKETMEAPPQVDSEIRFGRSSFLRVRGGFVDLPGSDTFSMGKFILMVLLVCDLFTPNI